MGRSEFEVMDGQSNDNLSSKRSSGCYITVLTGFILAFLAIAICVGVSLIVFFSVKPGSVPLNCTVPNADQISGPSGQQQPGNWPNEQCVIECVKQGICDATTKGSEGSTTPVVSTTEEPIIDVRLPKDLLPVHYDVEMRPDIYNADPKKFTNTGKVTIDLNCTKNTNTVTLHINKLNVTADRSLKRKTDNKDVALGEPDYEPERQFVHFHLQEELQAGEQYVLVLGYEGPLNNDLAGLYYSSYNYTDTSTGEQKIRYIATTQYQATDARKAFPCFDEPALKATFKIHLYRRPTMVALSNMPIEANQTMSDGWVKDTFMTTMKMSSYLLAMIICDFDYIENKTSSNVTFRVWSRKEAINQTKYALEQGVAQLEYFETFFGKDFPLPKQDMIAIPDFAAGAMENWGLITYRETALLYDEQNSAASNKQRVSTVVSHELAHQWFGNLVSPSWWDDLWLNEGFATYVEYIGVNETEPDWEMMEQFVTMDIQSTLRADSLASSHPIYVEVNHPDEISEIFDSISYGKGGSLIRMMRYFLGDEVFQEALKNYIQENQYTAVFHDILWDAMKKEADRKMIKDQNGQLLDVKGILDTWLLQMGYPLVDVSLGTVNNGQLTITLTQKHFLLDDTQEPDPKFPSPYKYTWDIPISYTTSQSPNFDVTEADVTWFYKSQNELTLKVDSSAQWVLVNPKQYGFYRVNYPESYWNSLIQQLKDDHSVIDPLNRAQLLDDAFNLATAGKLKITFAMGLTEYLANDVEDSYFPWSAFFTSSSYVSSALSRTQAYGDFETYMRSILKPFYVKHNAGWVVDLNQPITAQYMQSLSISRACRYNVGDCREKASELLQSFMNTSATDPNPIDANLRPTVYCYGLMGGGATEWEFIFNRFLSENVASEKIKLLQSLGCTQHEWLLQRLLDYAVDETKIRKQDSYIAVSTVSSNKLGGFLAWNWVRAKWDFLIEEFSTSGIGMLSRFVSSTTSGLFTPFELNQIEAFTATKGDLKTATRAFAQAKEQTQANIKYLANNYDHLKNWLSEKVKVSN